MPGGRIGKVDGGCAIAALATARRMGVTEVCFCIVTEDRPREGGQQRASHGGEGAVGCRPNWGSKVPAERVSVAVTEQWDEDQRGG